MKWIEHNLKLQNKDKYIWYASNLEMDKIKKSSLPVVIFLNGLSCSEQHFELQIKYFHKKKHPIIINHYRNHFKSDSLPIDELSLESIASDIKKIITKNKLENIVLIGHSMGANIATLLANHNSVEKVILIGGPASQIADSMFQSNVVDLVFPLFRKLGSLSGIGQKLIWRTLDSKLSTLVTRFFGFDPTKVSHDYVNQYLKEVASIDPRIFLKLFVQLTKQNFTPQLALVKKPVLLIGGEKDYMVPKDQYIAFSKIIKSSNLLLIEGASHVPQIEHPALINKKIYDFIKL